MPVGDTAAALFYPRQEPLREVEPLLRVVELRLQHINLVL